MLKNLSIRFKADLINIIMICGIFVLGIVGYSSINRVLHLEVLAKTVKLVQNHMECDMMHDAINGDAQGISAASSKGDKQFIKTYAESLDEHIKKLKENFEASQQIESSDVVKTLQKNASVKVDAYIKAASTIKGAAESLEDKPSEKAQEIYNKEFLPAFNELEGDFGEISKNINELADVIVSQSTVDADYGKKIILAAMVLSLILGIFVPLFLNYKMFNPLNKLLKVARSLMDNKLTEEPPYLHRSDEIGQVSRTLNELRLRMLESLQLKQMIDELPINIMVADPNNDFKIMYINTASKTMLQKLQQHLPIPVDSIIGSSIDIFHKNPQHVRQILSDPHNLPYRTRIKLSDDAIDLRVSPIYDDKRSYVGTLLYWTIVTQSQKLAHDFENSIGSVSDQISSSAETLEQRAIALQGAIEELSSAAREISIRLHDSLVVVQDAVNKGEAARNHMTQLSTAAERVSSVVTLIRSIAEKTNLLALNATIESARAGEAGKGFAVVANEVKTLANQTGTAITEINMQISDMQSFAENAFGTVKDMCDTIVSVNRIATDIATAVEEQQASTSEIVRSIGRSNDAASSESANSIMAMASQLKVASSALSRDCEGFLEKVNSI